MIFAILGKLSAMSRCWAGTIFAAFLCVVVIIFFFYDSFLCEWPSNIFFILANGVLLRGVSASQE